MGFASTFLEEGRQETKDKVRTPFVEDKKNQDTAPNDKPKTGQDKVRVRKYLQKKVVDVLCN